MSGNYYCLPGKEKPLAVTPVEYTRKGYENVVARAEANQNGLLREYLGRKKV